MYRRKAGRTFEVEEDIDHDEDEDSDPELVENLGDDNLEAVLGRPVASVSVKKGKQKVSSVPVQATAKRKPNRSKKGTVNMQAPPKGRTMLVPPVNELEDGQEDSSALLNAIGATSTDEDGVPSFPSAPQLSRPFTKPPASKIQFCVPGKSRSSGRGRGFASTSKLKVTQVREIFDSDEVEDFTLGLNNISDASVG